MAEAAKRRAPPLRARWRRMAGAAAVGLAAVLGAGAGAVLEGVRLNGPSALLFDQFARMSPRVWDPETPVRVVAIDDESLRRYGQWPWPRTYLVALLDRLEALGVAAVALDLVLADQDRTSPEIVAEAARRFDPLGGAAPRLGAVSNHDAQLARRIASSAVVLAALPETAAAKAAPYRGRAGFSFAGPDPRGALRAFDGVLAPLEPFVASAAGYGLSGVDRTDGMARRAVMLSRVGDAIAPSLAFEALRVAQGARGYVLRSAGSADDPADVRLAAARVGELTVPLTAEGEMWLRYAGSRPERIVPAWRVFEEDPATLSATLGGRIALVGATASGLRYVVNTPLEASVDGVVAQAEALEQIIAGDHLVRPDWGLGLELLAIVVCAGLFLAFLGPLGPIGGAILGAGVLGALGAGSWLAFERHGLLLSPVWPGVAATACYLALTFQHYLGSTRQTRQVRRQFERFVAPEVVEAIAQDPDSRLRAQGDLRRITLLFCDVRGFTSLSEAMPPQQLIAYLNAVLEEVSECVIAKGGTIDKFMGDCVMAFWNAPLATPRHESRAIEALFAIREAEARLNAGFARQGLPAVRFGVGVNAGVCSVGLMGSARRLEYSCVGDTVNVASRLQDLTKDYGVWNCVGGEVIAAAPEWCALELGAARLRGRQRTESVWTVLGAAALERDAELAALREAIAEIRGLREAGAGFGPAFDAALSAIAATRVAGVDGRVLAAHFRAA
jgi:adenylate cyclase